jgi:hypothetical protein
MDRTPGVVSCTSPLAYASAAARGSQVTGSCAAPASTPAAGTPAAAAAAAAVAAAAAAASCCRLAARRNASAPVAGAPPPPAPEAASPAWAAPAMQPAAVRWAASSSIASHWRTRSVVTAARARSDALRAASSPASTWSFPTDCSRALRASCSPAASAAARGVGWAQAPAAAERGGVRQRAVLHPRACVRARMGPMPPTDACNHLRSACRVSGLPRRLLMAAAWLSGPARRGQRGANGARCARLFARAGQRCGAPAVPAPRDAPGRLLAHCPQRDGCDRGQARGVGRCNL